MESTPDEALAGLFGTPAPAEQAPITEAGVSAAPELEQARRELAAVEEAMWQGDWEKLGRAMEALKRVLGTTRP